MANLDIKIREADLADLELIVDFISQKSEFDGSKNLSAATADKLQQRILENIRVGRIDGDGIGLLAGK
jgi:hypothetical protein